MREADSGSVRGGMDGSRILFFVALILLSAYFVLVASSGVSSPFVIVSGSSMEPTYHAGDLLLVQSVVPASVSEGDIVVFHTPRMGISAGLPARIAHRVVGIQPVDGMLGYLTRGDNSDRDSFVVPSNLLIGTVQTNLGPIGKLLALITNVKLLLIIGLPLLIAGGVFWLLTREEEEEGGENARSKPAGKPERGSLGSARVVADSWSKADFVTPYDNRKTDHAVGDVKNWLLTNRTGPEARKAFDDVTERLDSLRARRPEAGGSG